MAGNFRIDVVVSGGAATGTGTSLPVSAAIAASFKGGANINQVGRSLEEKFTNNIMINGQRMSSTNFNPKTGQASFIKEENIPFGYRTSVAEFNFNDEKIIKGGIFRHPTYGIIGRQTTTTQTQYPGDSFDVNTESQTVGIVTGKGFSPVVQANRQRLMSLGSVLAAKTVYSAVQYIQHTSGNSYYNQQLSNAMRFGGYGLLLLNSGPAAPFVAAGIVLNEGVDALLNIGKFEFDRKLENYEITNNLIVAGNASYGRDRGIGV
jgi:hypothetical protein